MKGEMRVSTKNTGSGKSACRSGMDCSYMGRRQFLMRTGLLAGGATLALNTGLFRWSTQKVMGRPAMPGEGTAQPLIRIGFIQSPPGTYLETGWPGMEYDSDASQALYTSTLEQAAGRDRVRLDIRDERIGDDATMDAFLERSLERDADGVLLINMEAQTYGMQGLYRILEQRGDRKLPVLGFVPHGTLHHHPGDYTPFREAPYCFLAASADIGWLDTGLRLLNARWQMANTRLAVVTGEEDREEVLDPLGTVIRYVPMQRYMEIEAETEGAEEIEGIARTYLENARDVAEPTEGEVYEAARAYVANRRLMDETGCHGLSIDCFIPVTSRRILPPCLAFMQLLDEGSVGVCEADIFPGLTMLLSRYLFDKPGFLHNPIHDTTQNLYAGGHCTAPTHMGGLGKEPEPYILRSHHEAGFGAVPQVLFTENQPATLWRFLSPGRLMISTGAILRNVDTQHDDGTGGCRTSFLMKMDDIRDVRQIREHHKILTYGRHLHTVRAWARLSGVALEDVTGGEVM